MQLDKIRNFCIIAHIDHGKSTLADRILLLTKAITERDFQNQALDNMDLERERGITIKASAVRVNYEHSNGQTYVLNLIDTPGHIDFNFEVAKSLRACEGAILIVDAAQGVEAQTVQNLYLAMEHDIEILPVINKIDLPHADIPGVKAQIKSILGIREEEIICISAKNNIGITEMVEALIDRIPPPIGNVADPLQALIFDSVYDTYRGVIAYVRIVNGVLTTKTKVRLMSTNRVYDVLEIGTLRPAPVKCNQLSTGEAGYVICNIRDAKELQAGDTITDDDFRAQKALPGYTKVRPMVYAGIYPVNPKDLQVLRDTIAKLNLNDSSFVFENENSASFGFGFRCGFLGLLHMDIVQERLEREYNLSLIVTAPSVVYQVVTRQGLVLDIENPSKFPEAMQIVETREPFVEAHMIIPKESLGPLMELSEKRRGKYISTEFIDETRVRLVYEFPLSEIIVDFNDKIKSLSRGYGSMDYDLKGFRQDNLVKIDIMLNGEICEALSIIAHRDQSADRGRELALKLKEVIPRQMIDVAIQSVIGAKIIARETVRALKKNVIAKCYGGDISRKRKLIEKQKEGKKRMKQFGSVSIPQEAFMAVLKKDNN